MINRSCEFSEAAKANCIEKYKKALNEMYPNVDTENKYVLFLKSDLWFPFETENISAEVKFLYDNHEKHFNSKIRRPYPNKTISQVSMLNGKRVCNMGIPVLFDSFEDLRKLTGIEIKWTIDLTDSLSIKQQHFVHVAYELDFEFIKGKRIYSIYSKDTIINAYENKADAKKYMSEFEQIYVISNNNRERFIIDHIGKIDKSNEDISGKAFEIVMATIGPKGVVNPGNIQKYKIYSYYSKAILEPNCFAENIL